ncbi:MAG: hypothetical protein H8E47_00305 [Anaerolineales bacterium]|nr:hypothetical protein [Anaerolineales bacterium]
MRKLFPLLLVVALVVPSSFPGLILSRRAEALGSGGEFPAAPLLLGSPAPLHPSSSAPPLPTGLYRSRVALRQPADWARLEKLGVTVLEQGDDWALVLADEEQLEALARLRFQPQATDELGMLVTAHAQAKPWLAASWAEVQRSKGAEEMASPQFLRSLAPALKSALAALSSVDDDADGLTNTQQQWWCTGSWSPTPKSS